MINISTINLNSTTVKSEEILLEVIYSPINFTGKVLILLSMNFIHIIDILQEKITGYFKLETYRKNPVIFIYDNFLHILGGEKNSDAIFSDAININVFFEKNNIEIIKKKIYYKGWFISKNKINKAAVIICDFGMFIIGRKQKNILKITCVNNNLIIDNCDKKIDQEVRLQNNSCYYYNYKAFILIPIEYGFAEIYTDLTLKK